MVDLRPLGVEIWSGGGRNIEVLVVDMSAFRSPYKREAATERRR